MKDNIKINNDSYDYIEIDKADLNKYIELLNNSDKKERLGFNVKSKQQ